MTTEAPSPTLADVVAVLERMYDPRWARDWDAVGLVCGDPDAPVKRVLLAVDPAPAVVEEALTARRLRARYVVGAGPKLQVALMTNLPAWARDRVLRRVSGQP